ncbi:MAG TPA: hypothetical protein VE959_17160 [Bryobacteraceae bacterium]|nr:hypothetical protein [Bryobacteraceae bacterium]
MIRMNSKTLAFLALLLSAVSCSRICHTPPASPTSLNLPFSVLDTRQAGLFERYPNVQPADAAIFWANSLDQSQRVEYAGGTRVVIKVETDHKWQAVGAVTAIHGNEPDASSAQQFNTQVVWSKDAASHFRKLRHWSEHWALLHPGQYGYQENRDGNPFLGMVVLFNESPKDPDNVDGQFHIGFRSLFGHYEAENGDIGDKSNYQLYKCWYGPIPGFEP